MSEIRITNCHVHLFTDRHVPSLFPHAALWPFRQLPMVLPWIAAGLRGIGQHPAADQVIRLHRFQRETMQHRQSAVLDRLIAQYPAATRFVVLPMDMRGTARGRIAADLAAQHDELAALAAAEGVAGRLVPFATLQPDQPGAVEELRRCLDQLGFRGLKLYPRLGYAPDHPVLMRQVYPMLQERGLPVISHCSRGGVKARGLSHRAADELCAPQAFEPVLRAFPELRVCLAHFGGINDWNDYIEEGIDPRDPKARAANWQVRIRDMIVREDWPNLWTDISYTLFQFAEFVPFLRIFLREERLARRVLFGSDFYMTRQENLSERAVCFRLRDSLGEELFRQIAQTNPEVWLGERAA